MHRAAAGALALDSLTRAGAQRRSPRAVSRDDGARAAWERACRPKPAKLIVNGRLREIVQRDLERKYSPKQIAGRLRLAFPDDPEMWVSAETIYQSL